MSHERQKCCCLERWLRGWGSSGTFAVSLLAYTCRMQPCPPRFSMKCHLPIVCTMCTTEWDSSLSWFTVARNMRNTMIAWKVDLKMSSIHRCSNLACMIQKTVLFMATKGFDAGGKNSKSVWKSGSQGREIAQKKGKKKGCYTVKCHHKKPSRKRRYKNASPMRWDVHQEQQTPLHNETDDHQALM